MSGRRRATALDVKSAVGLRERGWKLIDIAAALRVSEATVSRWCRGLTRRQVNLQVGRGQLQAGDRYGTTLALKASRAAEKRRAADAAQEPSPGAGQK